MLTWRSVHQRSDLGADVDILYGSTGTPFQYSPTFIRSLPASDGWAWSEMKLVSTNFGSDGLILQPDFVMFMVAWLAAGSGRF
jgi:hypothetical protein